MAETLHPSMLDEPVEHAKSAGQAIAEYAMRRNNGQL
jgi:hypothetical protein